MVTIKELNHILTSQGISQNHIEKMKEKRFEAVDFYYNFFEKKCKKGLQKVPLSKLKGLDTAWNIVGRSVYDCFTSIASDSPLNSNSECIVKYTRIMENVNSLKKNGLEFQYNFYESDSEKGLRAGLPSFIHFYNRELGIDCYFSDATHRSICALMFGAPFLTGYVTEYELDEKKYNNYQVVEESLKQLCESTFGSLSLKFTSDCRNEIEIIYFGRNTGLKGKFPVPTHFNDVEMLRFQSAISFLKELLVALEEKVKTNPYLIILNNLAQKNNLISRFIKITLRKIFRVSLCYYLGDYYFSCTNISDISIMTNTLLKKLQTNLFYTFIK